MNCPVCGGLGVTCIDDICRAIGECIHGDGDCVECGGDGYVDQDDEDWEPVYDEPEGESQS